MTFSKYTGTRCGNIPDTATHFIRKQFDSIKAMWEVFLINRADGSREHIGWGETTLDAMDLQAQTEIESPHVFWDVR